MADLLATPETGVVGSCSTSTTRAYHEPPGTGKSRRLHLGCTRVGGGHLIPDFEQSGNLPRGRFCVTVQEVHDVLVKSPEFATSTTRDSVWDDFMLLVELIKRKRVRVPAAFIGGGFVTKAPNPGDIDAAIIVDTSRIASPATLTAVRQIVSNPKAQGLKVDAFLIQWHPDGTENGRDPSYLASRGKWDDFWQRDVEKADRIPPRRSHAMPVRGYLEVILDGYV